MPCITHHSLVSCLPCLENGRHATIGPMTPGRCGISETYLHTRVRTCTQSGNQDASLSRDPRTKVNDCVNGLKRGGRERERKKKKGLNHSPLQVGLRDLIRRDGKSLRTNTITSTTFPKERLRLEATAKMTSSKTRFGVKPSKLKFARSWALAHLQSHCNAFVLIL